jgi:hypothetical protein
MYIGDSSISQINCPSDGYQRSVTNYIMLATKTAPTNTASQLALYPLSTHILKGAKTSFTVKAADAFGYSPHCRRRFARSGEHWNDRRFRTLYGDQRGGGHRYRLGGRP